MTLPVDQLPLFPAASRVAVATPRQVVPFRTQLLKWVGNKQRFAHEIVGYFPEDIATYREPFVGSGAVLATLAPEQALASDALEPLIALYHLLQQTPESLVTAYSDRWHRFMDGERKQVYGEIRTEYNEKPNAYDLLFLARTCYGGVIRFSRKGLMNTPCGPHKPVSPESFSRRVDLWRQRLSHTTFVHMDFEQAIDAAQPGDLVYCDPPYKDSESTLYGAQSFSLDRLFEALTRAKARGVRAVLSIDGTKRSGAKVCEVVRPDGLFETELMVNCGRSMLRRFQMEGKTLESEVVRDRLLLTYAL